MSKLEKIKSQQNPAVVEFLEKRNFYEVAERSEYFILSPLSISHSKREFEKPEQLDHRTLLTKARSEKYVGGFWFMFARNLEDGFIYWHSWVDHFCIRSPNLPYTHLEFRPIEDDEVMILVANEDFSRLQDMKQILYRCIEANNSIVGKTLGIKHNKLYYKPEFYADSGIMFDEASPIRSYIYSTTADAMSGIVAEKGVAEVLGFFPE